MKKRVIIVSIIFLLTSILSLTLLNNDRNTLENSKIKRDKTYAIMIQKEDKTGYVESENNIWPRDMTLNEELTNCTDETGTKVENPLTYEEGKIIVETNKKIYCYLYFDAKSGFGNQLLQNPTAGLNTTLEGGLYRYQGTEVDNYICFGTSDKDTCLDYADLFIYRIIGITNDGRIKLIKNEALESKMQWHSNKTTNTMWPNSDLYLALNGSSFLNNPTQVPTEWVDKIENNDWKYGDIVNTNLAANELYDIENSWDNTIKAKIGLIYSHDYVYAYQNGGLNCANNSELCTKSWMHITNMDANAPILAAWTMSRYGNANSNYKAQVMTYTGSVLEYPLTDAYSVFPVLYLKSTISYLNGTGTSTEPFIID